MKAKTQKQRVVFQPADRSRKATAERKRRFARWLRDNGIRWHDHGQDPDARYH